MRPIGIPTTEDKIVQGVLYRKVFAPGSAEGRGFFQARGGHRQGSVLSPILGNIYLDRVLDKWFELEVKPRPRGKATPIRFVDDFVICFEPRKMPSGQKQYSGSVWADTG
jgi:hypothetical protein